MGYRLLFFFSLIFHLWAFSRIGALPYILLMLFLGAGFSFIKEGEYFILFLIPLVNALPWFLPVKIPFNYVALSLYLIAGFYLGRGKIEKHPYEFWPFLSVLWLGALFLLLRWSNITLSPLALFKNTPVAPGGPRLSFGIFLPAVALFLMTAGSLGFGFFQKLKRDTALKVLSASTGISFIFGILQMGKICLFLPSGPWKWIFRYNGTFSDPNSAGIFASILSIWILLRSSKFRDILWSLLPLAMVFISSSRTGILISGLGFVFFFLSRNISGKLKLKTGLILLFVFLVSMPHLWKRMGKYTKERRSITLLSEGRDVLFSRALTAFKDSPLSGIGPGNFIFYSMYKFHHPKLNDVVPSVYLSSLAELGIVGLLLFLLFLSPYALSPPSPERTVLIVVFLSFFVHTALWFPEVVLLFFFLLSSQRKSEFKIPPLINLSLIFFFLLGGIISFQTLHPAEWSIKRNKIYTYGVYPREGDFHWTTGNCGIYWKFPGSIKIVSDFPFDLTGVKAQKLLVYWRGTYLKTIIFTPVHRREEINIRGKGFLEFRIYPTFIPYRIMNNRDKRKLGIKILGLP